MNYEDAMTTLEMEVALMEYKGVQANIIVPNVSWEMDRLHECDLICLSQSGYATEIEIKATKADLLKDIEKKHNHRHRLIKNLYFAVPDELKDIAIDNIPKRAGLYSVKRGFMHYHNEFRGYYQIDSFMVEIIKKPVSAILPIKWTEQERNQLIRIGVKRILVLKKKLLKIIIKDSKCEK